MPRQLSPKVKRIIFYVALLITVICMIVPGWDKASWLALILAISILFDRKKNAKEEQEQAEKPGPNGTEEETLPEKTEGGSSEPEKKTEDPEQDSKNSK